MEAIRIMRTLDSETIYLPQLRPLVGRDVEIIVLAVEGATPTSVGADASINPLADSVIRYDAPFDPAVRNNDS